MKIIEAEYGMYRLILPDGGVSIMYNKTRATELLRRTENGENWETVRIGYDKPE